jgi:hypothetical protein
MESLGPQPDTIAMLTKMMDNHLTAVGQGILRLRLFGSLWQGASGILPYQFIPREKQSPAVMGHI